MIYYLRICQAAPTVDRLLQSKEKKAMRYRFLLAIAAIASTGCLASTGQRLAEVGGQSFEKCVDVLVNSAAVSPDKALGACKEAREIEVKRILGTADAAARAEQASALVSMARGYYQGSAQFGVGVSAYTPPRCVAGVSCE